MKSISLFQCDKEGGKGGERTNEQRIRLPIQTGTFLNAVTHKKRRKIEDDLSTILSLFFAGKYVMAFFRTSVRGRAYFDFS